ncbi:MAG: PQQ-dependent sugar dehydrogenase [Pseudomonadota bacterium]
MSRAQPPLKNRLFLSLALAGIVSAPAIADDQDIHRSAYHDYRVVELVEGLERPWSMAFLPNGDLLVTEKPGRLRLVRDGALVEAPIEGIPAVHNVGQGGLLDVVPHPDYAENGWIYLSYARPLEGEESTTAVIRGRLDGMTFVDQEDIFEARSNGRGHYGSRLVFDDDQYLFITVGDRQARPQGDEDALKAHPAQNLELHQGVVLRLHDDGRIPDDNPFVGRDDALPETWSYGHRNPQGMIVHPETNEIWITEHGPEGGDELNLVKAGANYGWPVVGYGVNYGSGTAIHGATRMEGTEEPLKVWVPSAGTSGLAFYQGEAFKHWNGHLLSGGLAGQRVDLLELKDGEVVREETIAQNHGRIRDVRIGPDELVYLAVDSREDGPSILRLEPLPRGPIN